MARGNGQAGFSERVSIRFKQGKTDSQSSALIGELIEFLNLKVSMGVHQQWIKQAIFDQFMRERSGAAAPSIQAVIRGNDAQLSAGLNQAPIPEPDHVTPIVVPPPAEPEPERTVRVSEQTDLLKEASGEVGSPKKVKGLPRGMASLMGV